MGPLGPDQTLYNLDHSCMIKTLVSLEFPVNRLWEPFPKLSWFCFGYSDLSIPCSTEVTPPAYDLVSKSRRRCSEKTRPAISTTLLGKGRAPMYSCKCAQVYHAGEADRPLSFLDYRVRYESTSFVRLLLQYVAKSFLGTAQRALTRRDPEIMQALKDHRVVLNSTMGNLTTDNAIVNTLFLANFSVTASSGIPESREDQSIGLSKRSWRDSDSAKLIL